MLIRAEICGYSWIPHCEAGIVIYVAARMHTCVPPCTVYSVLCTMHTCTPTPNQPPLYSCQLERTTITEAVACETVQLIRTPDYQSSRGDTEDTSNVNGQNKVSIITYIFGQQQYKLQNKASIITIYFWIRTMKMTEIKRV